jgi:hypothetical protein
MHELAEEFVYNHRSTVQTVRKPIAIGSSKRESPLPSMGLCGASIVDIG